MTALPAALGPSNPLHPKQTDYKRFAIVGGLALAVWYLLRGNSAGASSPTAIVPASGTTYTPPAAPTLIPVDSGTAPSASGFASASPAIPAVPGGNPTAQTSGDAAAIIAAYEQYLGRPPTASELANWMGGLVGQAPAGGAAWTVPGTPPGGTDTLQQILNWIPLTPEAAGYVLSQQASVTQPAGTSTTPSGVTRQPYAATQATQASGVSGGGLMTDGVMGPTPATPGGMTPRPLLVGGRP